MCRDYNLFHVTGFVSVVVITTCFQLPLPPLFVRAECIVALSPQNQDLISSKQVAPKMRAAVPVTLYPSSLLLNQPLKGLFLVATFKLVTKVVMHGF